MEQFYGNTDLQKNFRHMSQSGRIPHGILLYGEAGCGKKTLAKHIASMLLCQGANKPCGVCKSCRMLESNAHPDVIYVEHSGKRNGFSVDTVRAINSELIVPPNEGNAKIYIFTDCDNMDERPQNLLLKSVEEPPDYGYFIFTGTSPSVLLPTIRSRIVAFTVSPVQVEECQKALLEKGYSQEEAAEAVSAFHGNIGKCIDYLENESLREIVTLTKAAINSIIKKDEYELLKIVASLGKDRERVKQFLLLLDYGIRDALALRYNPDAEVIGCCAEFSRYLGGQIPTHGAEKMHEAILNVYDCMKFNVNLPLALSAMCAEIMVQG